MPIKLAFSTVACPEWTIEQVARQAKQMGYAGVELRTLGPGGTVIASDPSLGDAKTVRDALRKEGIEPVCLSTSVSLHHRQAGDAHRAGLQVRQSLEMAAEIGAPAVRIFGHEVLPGESRRSVIQRIASRVPPLAERAGDLGVKLLFENGGSINTAQDWWWLFNLVQHPMVGVCWNVATAAAFGEGPAVSVPVMNSRIGLAKVKDTVIGEGSGYVPLGEGTVEIEHFIKRLLGIGYDGYVVVEWDRAWLPALAPAEEVLPKARETLNGWIASISESIDKSKPKLAKEAAKNAPKKRAELQAK